MTPSLSLLLDLAIVALLLYWFLMGYRRGLVVSLCSLLAVVVSWAGGWYLSNYAYQPLAERLEPTVVQLVSEHIDDIFPAGEAELPQSGQTKLPSLFSQAMQGQLNQHLSSAKEATIAHLSAMAAQFLAKAILFLVGFLGVQVVWTVLYRALKLVTRLPGVRFLNKALGAVFGLIKGVLLLMILRWLLCDLLGWIPSEVAQGSYLLGLLTSLPRPAIL